MPFRCNGAAHEGKELGSEQRVVLQVVDPEWPLIRDLDVCESRLA